MKRTSISSIAIARGIDALSLGFVALLCMLAIVFHARIDHASATLVELMKAGVLYAFAVFLADKVPLRFGFAIRIAASLALLSFLFQAVEPMQHLLVEGWLDEPMIAFERSLLGFETSTAMQRFVHPVLTEWVMFSYVAYVPLLAIVALVCYRSKGREGLNDYLFHLTAVNILCGIGFILFPIASPMFHFPQEFTVPLHGWFFTACGEWMRANLHYPGGSLPSPHCAAGTIMMVMLYRYNKRWFIATAPIFGTIYVAIVYGRYHYIEDGIAGIIVALLVVRYSHRVIPFFEQAYNAVTQPLRGIVYSFINLSHSIRRVSS